MPGSGDPYQNIKFGAPDRIRTCGLRIRSPLLYPAELRAQRRIHLSKPTRYSKRKFEPIVIFFMNGLANIREVQNMNELESRLINPVPRPQASFLVWIAEQFCGKNAKIFVSDGAVGNHLFPFQLP